MQKLVRCQGLEVLDVSCNRLEMFPSKLSNLGLREFYFENNPLLPQISVPVEQQEEVLQLKVGVGE